MWSSKGITAHLLSVTPGLPSHPAQLAKHAVKQVLDW